MPRSWVRAGPGKPRGGTDMPPRYFILSDRCVVGKSFLASCPPPSSSGHAAQGREGGSPWRLQGSGSVLPVGAVPLPWRTACF